MRETWSLGQERKEEGAKGRPLALEVGHPLRKSGSGVSKRVAGGMVPEENKDERTGREGFPLLEGP